jgi:hypothetical protein
MGDAMNINNPEKGLLTNGGLIPKKPKKVIPAPAWDGRGELLKAIRDGKLDLLLTFKKINIKYVF